MKNFRKTPEFEKEYKRLKRKYRSLDKDFVIFEEIISQFPTGTGTKFTIVHSSENVKIVKARLSCSALRESSLRIIYAYHEDTITFVYIELYFKGEKENENRERIKEYIENLNKS